MIPTQDPRDRVDQGRLAVRAGSVIVEKCVLRRGSRKAVTDDALNISLEVFAAVGHVTKKGQEHRARAAWSDGRNLGHVVVRPVAAEVACRQIDHAVRRVQEHGVGVPLIDVRRVATIRLGQSLDGRNGFRRGDADLPLLRSGRSLTADRANLIVDLDRLVYDPQDSVPSIPTVPLRDVPKPILVLFGELESELVLA